ncbi:hypothetical protein BU26DRAFT_523060 [Trematosphaeria pertusa]|uniref:Uncharacterized protein n=1 Tax=Trematosphaeria pertusa TaxID=390896 RepID=A0A6A6I334_9PLEO|nr:uncharacterized protein BU26DRAFT_523060 [Trematosphaeria pertusa]KAF2244408.1 hypothetical protein BU26DRAFT_523060 [Trematosphaeria pertusa]
MPATQAAIEKAGAPTTATSTKGGAAQGAQEDQSRIVRLHITPLTPALLNVYLPPTVLPLAKNISYHTVVTFPEKGFGYVELPAMEAQKLKKKLNGSTLKGSKVRIEDAKPEKRKAGEDAEDAKENGERPVKRAKKEKRKKEQGVLAGVELPDERKVKRGWTDPPVKSKKEKKGKDKEKSKRKESKYTKEPEVLFKAKLTPVAAAEVAQKEKKKDKKDKKKSRSKRDVVVHEFEKNAKQPSFLKEAKVSAEKKPAVDYVDGKGWVDEDGNVVEAETGKARNRRVLELVDSAPVQPTTEKKPSATPSPKSSPAPKPAKKEKKKTKMTPPPSSSESEDEESSVVSSSEDDSSGSDPEDGAEAEALPSSPAQAPNSDAPEIALTPSSPAKKEVHPLEALFKRSKPPALSTPGSNTASTPGKGLAPINTSFSFFDESSDAMDVDADADPSGNPPVTPFTQRDLEWRGLRSAAPTPDTAAIGRRFSFPWRNSSQEMDEEEEGDDEEAEKQLSNNTKANASATHLPGVAEEDEEDAEAGAGQGAEGKDEEEEPESEFKKWFWENQGSLNRAWKKRRRDALKAKRLSENKRAVGGGRVG